MHKSQETDFSLSTPPPSPILRPRTTNNQQINWLYLQQNAEAITAWTAPPTFPTIEQFMMPSPAPTNHSLQVTSYIVGLPLTPSPTMDSILIESSEILAPIPLAFPSALLDPMQMSPSPLSSLFQEFNETDFFSK